MLANWFGSVGSSAAGYILPFLFVLTIVVFFHELGHFVVARWCGVFVRTFSVGFGPELIGFTDRKGTRWRLSLIPLGGYVKFLGDDSEASTPSRAALEAMPAEERSRTFAGKSVGARAAIVAAGPIANFVLAIAIFTAIFSIVGRETISARVDRVTAGSAAEVAGFKVGDVIVSIDGDAVTSFTDLQRAVGFRPGETLHFVVDRGGADIALDATPVLKDVTDTFGNKQRIGVLGIARDPTATDVVTEKFSVPQAAWLGVKETWFIVDHTLSYLVGVVRGRESPDQLGGPIRVAEVSAQVATLGFVALVNLAAILSVSIGLINLFPIPMLDGGHLLYFLAEAIRGKPLSDRVQDIGFRIGLAAVLALMIFATWNDIIHLSSL
ncbi:MAG: RIP metalloprotease RseP [Bauldia sp.]